jgi:hypothetical protein
MMAQGLGIFTNYLPVIVLVLVLAYIWLWVEKPRIAMDVTSGLFRGIWYIIKGIYDLIAAIIGRFMR